MDIKYIGHSSFLIKTNSSNGGTKVVTDPFDPKVTGLKFPTTEADVVTVSHHHKDHDFLEKITGDPLIIDWPGQFERKNVRISGYSYFHDKKKGTERGVNILYKIEEELSILHCGDLGEVPDDKFIDEIGEVDILMLPVGGVYSLDANEAVEMIKKIEPLIVIPMHYQTTTLQQLAPLSDFLKKMGAENTIPVPKLTVKKEELVEEIRIVVMEIMT